WLHMQCHVNRLTHLNHEGEGNSSENVWWLGPFQLTAWGENWHRNHHTHAGSARLGLRWYQTDIGWYFICALELVRLAYSVKRPKGGAENSSNLDGSQILLDAPARTIYGILIRVAGGTEPAPCTDCQITRLSANSGTLSGRLKSHWLDSAAPGALPGFFSSSGIRASRCR